MHYKCLEIKGEGAAFSFKTLSNSLLADSAFWTLGRALLAVPPLPGLSLLLSRERVGRSGGREDTD